MQALTGSPWLCAEAGPCGGGEQGGSEEAAGESGQHWVRWGGWCFCGRSWNDFVRETKRTPRRGEVSVGQREVCRVTSEF